jgi:hypothetical protein
MTRGDDFIGQLEGYLEERDGMTPLPAGVRDAIRAELPRTRQIGPPWGPMRYLSMASHIPSTARFGLGAALIVVALLAASLLYRSVGRPPTPTPTSPPLENAGALPVAPSDTPGTYLIGNPYNDGDPIHFNCNGGCPAFDSITLSLPDGWAVADGLISRHRDQPNEVAISVWAPGKVYSDPCHWQDSSASPAPGGEVAQALRTLGGRRGAASGAIASPGARILEGLEFLVPTELDITTCDQGQYRTWTVWQLADLANSRHAPGQIDVVYVIDLDRRPLFIDASHMPGASAQDLAELQAVFASIRIDQGF